jgi:hypothetical protein
MPDGSTLRLAKVTSGVAQTWQFDHPVKLFLGRILPRWITTGWDYKSVTFHGGSGSAAVWFRLSQPWWRAHSSWRPARGERLTLAVGYGGGRWFAREASFLFGEADRWVAPFDLRVYPRRAKEIRLRSGWRFASGRFQPAKEFWIANPLPGPYPTWSAQRLPRRLEVPGTGTELRTTQVGLANLPPGTWAPGTASLKTRYRLLDAPERCWLPVRLEVDDATGNRFDGKASWHRGDRAVTVDLQPIAEPVPGEALRLTTWLAQATASARSGEHARFRVQLAADGSPRTTSLQQATDAGSVSLSVKAAPVRRGRKAGTGWTVLELRPSHRAQGRVVRLLRAADDQGRRIASEPDYWPGNAAGEYEAPLQTRLPRGARWVELDFTLQPYRKVQTVIAPPRPLPTMPSL